MSETVSLVRAALDHAVVTMAQQANRRRQKVDVVVGQFAWLSTEHLKLAPNLSRKLAAKFVGPFKVLQAVGPVAFRLALPPRWCVHDVFHAS